MAVSRSHLHSSAARSAFRALAADRAAISPASVRTRRVLSPSEPSFAWKVTRVEAVDARGERLLAVLLPEERRIRQARAHHALIALAHLRRIAALDVAHGDEPRQQRAVLVLTGK